MSDPLPLLSCRALSKEVVDSTGRLRILQDISFDISEGESVAIVGASGSGKSTLLGLLAGLDLASSGQIFFEGQDILALSEDERARWRSRHLGFVFQSFQLLGHLNALENVMLPLELQGHRDARRLATQMLEQVGLASRLTHKPRVLSGGEQQRVALARAFVVRPRLLLADEPTGSLDAVTGAQAFELMLSLKKEAGTTLVLVTHDMQLAARCDRQLHVEAGRLITEPAAAPI